MKQIGFFGIYDKKDLILNISKVLTNLNKKILAVDATSMQRMKYIIPNVTNSNSLSYVSEYCNIDIAVGFMNLGQIAAYLGTNNLQYDIIFVDSDNVQTMASFMFPRLEKIFYVTSFDQYETQRTREILRNINQPMKVTKVLVSADLSSNQEQALNHILSETALTPEHTVVQFADTNIDRKAVLQNQLTKQIILKHYTNTYKDSLEFITSLATEGMLSQADIKRTIKKM